jgi:hypothetical protein
MARKTVPTVRVQVYLNDPRIIAGLNREARVAKVPLSQAAGRVIARGLQRSLPADPEDRLLRLERALRDHMRAMARDMQIVQELQLENARALFHRLPDTQEDEDPTVLASVEHRVERLLDAVARHIVAGGTPAKARAREHDGEPEAQTPHESRSFQARDAR